MKIFVLNAGSSSIKCFLYNFQSAPSHPISPLWKAHLEWKNSFEKPSLTITGPKGETKTKEVTEKSIGSALEAIVHSLTKDSVITYLEEIGVVGHRIVHGGTYFNESLLLTPEVKEKIRSLSQLAPLHNQLELEGVEILQKLFKNRPHIAVFDTAFHHTLPKAAQIYPGPYSWYEEGIRRYGFHGISFEYCMKQSGKLLHKDPHSLKMVICHLGSGASLCAIQNGKSIDTTMGFTPLDGLMMDTRPGSIDPGIILHLLETKKISIKELSQTLYEKSGLLGISGISSDMRDILEERFKGNVRADLTLDIYLHRLRSLIGAMIASLQGIDVLIFTAGIGENSPLIRERITDTFSFLGTKLDPIKNGAISSEDRDISTQDAKVKVLLIHTQEAFAIASICFNQMSGSL